MEPLRSLHSKHKGIETIGEELIRTMQMFKRRLIMLNVLKAPNYTLCIFLIQKLKYRLIYLIGRSEG